MTLPASRFPLPRVAVVGAGTMGHGIAYVAALAGCEVALTDSRADALPHATARIDALIAGAVTRAKLDGQEGTALARRVRIERSLDDAVHGATVIIEAVVEDLQVKQRVLANVERAAPPDALLASNTSSLSIGHLAGSLSTPGRLVGMHFFNPVHLMKLVEIVTHDRAAPGVSDRAVTFARQLGKEPIVVKDSPGFASSRLGVVLGLEAMRMLEQGVASAEDIDKAMELGYNHPMGPLKLTDVVGLDVRLAIAEYLYATLKVPHFEPPAILRDKVKKGELGKKTGKGFYSWST